MSNHGYSSKEQSPLNTLGTINSHITVAPIEPSRCQNELENGNLREQLADALCRHSFEPLTFVTRGMCCGYCRPMFYPNMPCHQSGQRLSPPTPQQKPNEQKEFLQKSEPFPSIEDGTESQSSHYSGRLLPICSFILIGSSSSLSYESISIRSVTDR